MPKQRAAVGTSIARKEGPEKLCGVAKYIDDYGFDDVLHGVTLRSSIARGRIVSITYRSDFDWSSTVVADADDIPGDNHVLLLETDQPLLAARTIKHFAEPILVLGHPSREMAYEALRHIDVEYESEPPLIDMDDALAKKTLIHGDDNLLSDLEISRGDLDRGFREAELIVEGEYRVPHQEQAYIENNGVAAWTESDGGLTIMGSLQCPYYVHKAILPIFARERDEVRIIQATTGGGFGGKEEYPNMIAGHAALLALKSGKKVKLVYDRHEDMLATTKRHPCRVRIRSGVTGDGKLTALDIDVVMDGGAYVTLSPVVLSRGILHATGPYQCPHVRIRGRAVATNTPPNGAFRGFGAPQTLFAAELHMERVAEAIGVPSLELRRRNLFKEGSVTATGQHLTESVGASDVLEKTVAHSHYERLRRANERWNKRRSNPTWRGIGLATVFHGSGFTGSGEVYLESRAGVHLDTHGRVQIDAASTEIGQGTTTMLAQIVADTLDVPFHLVDVVTPDTATVPDSGPTVASRTCMVVGSLVQRASQQLRERLEAVDVRPPFSSESLRVAAARLTTESRRVVEQYQPPQDVRWDDRLYRGEAYAVYSYAAMSVELEVDKLTYEVTLRRVVTYQDVGRAIQPTLVKGQILGGTAQALGYALLERPVYEAGRMMNASLTNYIIPTSLDTPTIEAHIVEKPYRLGPFGAKGVGELPMDVPAPAVAAAIHQAIGHWMTELPITPESIAARLSTAKAGDSRQT